MCFLLHLEKETAWRSLFLTKFQLLLTSLIKDIDMNFVVFYLNSSHLRITQVQKNIFENMKLILLIQTNNSESLCLFVCTIWERKENAF